MKKRLLIFILTLLASQVMATKRDISVLFVHYSVGSQMSRVKEAFSGSDKCSVFDSLQLLNVNNPVVYGTDTAVFSFRDYMMNSETGSGGLSDTDWTDCFPPRFDGGFYYDLNQGWARPELMGQDGGSGFLRELFDIPQAERDTMFFWRMFEAHNVPDTIGSSDSIVEQYDLILFKQNYFHWAAMDAALVTRYKAAWEKIVDSLTISNPTINIGFLFGTPLYASGALPDNARTDSAEAHISFELAVWFRDTLMTHSNFDSTRNCWLFDSYTYLADTAVENTTRWGLATANWLDADPGSHLSQAGAELGHDSLVSFITQAGMDILIQEAAPGTNYYVSKSGNDGNTGLDTASAFATINKLTDMCDAPGDIGWLCAKPGDKWNEQNTWTGGGDRKATLVAKFSGTSGNRITFKSFIGGPFTDRATITGFNTSFADSMFNQGFVNVDGHDFITIDSIVFDSCGLAGAYSHATDVNGPDSMQIINCVMKNIHELPIRFDELNTGGIYFNSATGDGLGGANAARVPDDFAANFGWLIDNDSVLYLRSYFLDTVFDTIVEEPLEVDTIVIGPEYRGPVHDNVNGMHGRGLRGSAISNCFISGAYFAIRLKTDCDSNTIEYNELTNTTDAAIHIGNESRHSKVRFNIAYNVLRGVNGRGVVASGSDPDSCHHNAIYNNTFVVRASGLSMSVYSISDTIITSMIDGYWANNIILEYNSGAAVYYDKDLPQEYWDYNCYWNSFAGENIASVDDLSTDDPFDLSEWRTFSTDSLGFSADQNAINLNPNLQNVTDSSAANFLVPDSLLSPALILTEAAGSVGATIFDGTVLPTFGGAKNPFPLAAEPTTKTALSGQLKLSGKVSVPGE